MPKLDFLTSLRALCLFLFLPSMAFSFGPYGDVEILSVKDGDTIEVMVEVYPDTFIHTDVRVHGIDTPETRRGVKSGKRIPECEIALGNRSKEHAQIIIDAADHISLINVDPKSTKYAGRISGDFLITIELHQTTFSDLMVRSGHAIAYDGGTRDVWPCEDET